VVEIYFCIGQFARSNKVRLNNHQVALPFKRGYPKLINVYHFNFLISLPTRNTVPIENPVDFQRFVKGWRLKRERFSQNGPAIIFIVAR